MATDIPDNEIQAFYHFLGEKLVTSDQSLTPEESVEAFRAHQRDAERLKKHLEPSLEQARRGDSKPLDGDALIDRVNKRLANEGITD